MFFYCLSHVIRLRKRQIAIKYKFNLQFFWNNKIWQWRHWVTKRHTVIWMVSGNKMSYFGKWDFSAMARRAYRLPITISSVSRRLLGTLLLHEGASTVWNWWPLFFELPLSCSPICSHWEQPGEHAGRSKRVMFSLKKSFIKRAVVNWTQLLPHSHERCPLQHLRRVENISGGTFSSREHWKPSGPSTVTFFLIRE